jgi:hypothetical protein
VRFNVHLLPRLSLLQMPPKSNKMASVHPAQPSLDTWLSIQPSASSSASQTSSPSAASPEPGLITYSKCTLEKDSIFMYVLSSYPGLFHCLLSFTAFWLSSLLLCLLFKDWLTVDHLRSASAHPARHVSLLLPCPEQLKSRASSTNTSPLPDTNPSLKSFRRTEASIRAIGCTLGER